VTAPATKKLHIKTYGCQMNVYDSARMLDVLAPLGYGETDDATDADLLLLNTCHIREKAAEKVYSELGRIQKRRLKTGKPRFLGVAGCVAQAEGEEVMRRAPYVDMVIGSQSYHLLPELLAKAEKNRCQEPAKAADPFDRAAQAERQTVGKEPLIALDFPEEQKFDLLPEAMLPQGASAFVSVQEGCDKFCTFCVVPYTRGVEYSRPVQKVLDEVKVRLDQGAVEITLLGQNVNAYHGQAPDAAGVWGLARLMEEMAKLDGLRRIRYTTSHPRDMTPELLQAHADNPKLMPYLHLPIQAGSDKILKAMNRKHKAADYLAIIEKLRTIRPDIAFSGDFIVGFPDESDADFEATLRVVESVFYASAYSFKYSQRPGTPAAVAATQVPEPVKEERLARLQALLNQQQLAFNQRSVGQTHEVLFEKQGRKAGQWIGKSPYMQSVLVESAQDLAGKLARVQINGAHPNHCSGSLLAQPLSLGQVV
jgi:tRNA-2-methylthio-N6-dimethylallyladenosine synthase